MVHNSLVHCSLFSLSVKGAAGFKKRDKGGGDKGEGLITHTKTQVGWRSSEKNELE